MDTQRTALKKATDFANACQTAGVKIEKAILFGSFAKGTFHKWSDIDVALVSPQFTDNFLTNNHFTSKIHIHFPDIEVHHFTTQDFTLENPFVHEIVATGVELQLKKNGS